MLSFCAYCTVCSLGVSLLYKCRYPVPPHPFRFSFLLIRPPPRSTLFPYTRSSDLDRSPNITRLASKDRSGDVVRDRHSHERDRKSTRLNSSHTVISYAVFCLKKKITNSRADTSGRTPRGPEELGGEVSVRLDIHFL